MNSLESMISLWDTKVGKSVATYKGTKKAFFKSKEFNNQNLLLPSFFMKSQSHDKEKYIINLDEDNIIRIWDCSKSKPVKLHKIDAEEKGIFHSIIIIVKSWDYNQKNIACILKNNTARIFGLE